VTDTCHHSLLHDGFDEARSLGPLGRERDKTDVPAGVALETTELLEIGRADPARRMCAAWAVLRRNVRAFEMEGFHCLTNDGGAFGDGFLSIREVLERRGYVVWRARDHSGEKTRDPAGEHRTDGIRDLFVSGGCRVIVHASKAVDLQIDKAGRDECRVVQRPNQVIDYSDGAIEGNFDTGTACNVEATTLHLTFPVNAGLCTSFPQPWSAKCKRR
jgi:hypothetical protein